MNRLIRRTIKWLKSLQPMRFETDRATFGDTIQQIVPPPNVFAQCLQARMNRDEG